MHAAQWLDIFKAPLLRERTSIRLGGAAIAEVRITALRGLEQLPGTAMRLGGRIAPLGAGTNIIAMDEELPLILVTKASFHETSVIGEESGRALLKADAALKLPALLAKAASLGLTGLEGLSGIPGSVGGAVSMNAGSYGVSIGDHVHSVEVFSPLLGLVERPAEDFDFAYRSCRLRGHEGWFLVCAVTLYLNRGERGAIRERMREVLTKKQAAQPVGAWSAGCVFKNPAPDAPAGRLMEEAGLKGLGMGGMRFSTVHANFLVNEGGGASEQAMSLIELARERVLQETGHMLQTEVRLWP